MGEFCAKVPVGFAVGRFGRTAHVSPDGLDEKADIAAQHALEHREEAAFRRTVPPAASAAAARSVPPGEKLKGAIEGVNKQRREAEGVQALPPIAARAGQAPPRRGPEHGDGLKPPQTNDLDPPPPVRKPARPRP